MSNDKNRSSFEGPDQVIERILANPQKERLSTGFDDLDGALSGGLLHEQLIVLGARPGMGKTTLALGIALHLGQRDGGGAVAVFSPGLSNESIGFSLLAQISGIPSRRLKSGRLTGSDLSTLTRAAESLAKTNLFLDDRSVLTVSAIRECCQALRLEHGRIDLVVIDSLQLVGATNATSPNNDSSEIVRDLKSVSVDIGCALLLLSELDRKLEARSNKRPLLSDFTASRSMGTDADTVMFIYRDEVYNRNTEDTGIAEIIIARNRTGEVGAVRLGFHEDIPRFVDLGKAHHRGSSTSTIEPL